MSDKYSIGKIPPQATDIEESVLGCLINIPDSIINAEDKLVVNTFYKRENQLVFEIIQDLLDKKKQVDMMCVMQEIRNKDLPISPSHISQIINKACSQYKIKDYVLILKEKEIARRQIELGSELTQRAYDEAIDPLETNNFLNDSAYDLSNMSDLSVDHTNQDILKEVVEQIQRASESKGLTGINTGYGELNQITGGLQPTELIILAARPAMGKTALALCLMLNATYSEKRVLFFSLEMGKDQLMKRLISIDAQISGEKLKLGSLDDTDWTNVHSTIGRLDSDKFKVLDSVYSLNGIINKSKQERLKGGVDFIVIDYLQLINNEKKGRNREQEVASIARGLKMLSKDLGIPVLCLSQLSRSLESRGGDKRPMLSDLRESGAIEQDADIVMFLYRAQYYGLMEDENGNSTEGKAELIISKNRSGSLANIELDFIHECTKFSDPNGGYEQVGLQPNNDF